VRALPPRVRETAGAEGVGGAKAQIGGCRPRGLGAGEAEAEGTGGAEGDV